MSRVFIVLIIALLVLAFILLATDYQNLSSVGLMLIDEPNLDDSYSDIFFLPGEKHVLLSTKNPK